MWFRGQRSPKATEQPLTRAQAFAARPVAVKVLKREPLDDGGVRLTIPFSPTGMQRILLRVPEDAERQIDLDAVGAKVFVMCDGKTSVKELARRFAREHQVDSQEAETAVATFIRMLMRKRLVVIGVDK